jgi:hypothetical protein
MKNIIKQFIVAIVLPSFKRNIFPILLIRVFTMKGIYIAYFKIISYIIQILLLVIIFYVYIQSIGSNIGHHSGLFHVTYDSINLVESSILFISAFGLSKK